MTTNLRALSKIIVAEVLDYLNPILMQQSVYVLQSLNVDNYC